MKNLEITEDKVFANIDGKKVQIGEFTKRYALFWIQGKVFQSVRRPKDIKACAEDFLKSIK